MARSGEDANPQACLQLQAQLHYRLNQSKESIQAYDRLFKEHKVRAGPAGFGWVGRGAGNMTVGGRLQGEQVLAVSASKWQREAGGLVWHNSEAVSGVMAATGARSFSARSFLSTAAQVESLELKTNVVAAYVAAELSSEVPGLMSAMQVNEVTGAGVGSSANLGCCADERLFSR